MKKKKYEHIKKAERLEIAMLRDKERYSLRDIANILKRNVSTVSREIRFNSVNGCYDPNRASHKAYVKRKYSKYQGMKVVENSGLREYVEKNIRNDWSPEQIAGRLREIDRHLKYASRGAVYKYIDSVYGRALEKHLRYKGRPRKGGNKQKVAELANRVFIDQRPEIVGNRERFGDWEGDFIVSNKAGEGTLVVLYERKAMYTIIKKIMSRRCDVVNRYIQEMTGGLVCFSSLTIDNDISFRKHQELSELLSAPIYFCRPYHAWEKGGVENINKLIRQYIAKGSDISKYPDDYIKKVEDKLNNRPRKGLDYKTPLEVMVENNQFKTLTDFGIINLNKKSPSVALEG